jgi:methionyl-tRNA formyltransferase
MEKLRIVFMGTPEFAVGILDTIIKTTMNCWSNNRSR